VSGVSGSERAVSFGEIAQWYDRYRPGPPAEVADWLLPAGAGQVAELCAGTGTFSRVLATRVDHVVAVDLDPRMLTVLRARSPRLDAICANGEVLPFRDGTLDAVVVSSGWHWLDADRASAEAARVLRLGGVLGVVWSGPDRRVDWVGELLRSPNRPEGMRAMNRRVLSIAPGQPLSEPERRVSDWSLPRTPSELIGLAGTYSSAITSGLDERQVALRRAAELLEQHPMLRGKTRVDLPMRTLCWRAVKLATRLPPCGWSQ
jgi:SAM-dependent methyltransferase